MLRKITLSDFRNYKNGEYEFSERVNLIAGQNAKVRSFRCQ